MDKHFSNPYEMLMTAATQAWQVMAIKKALKKANSKNARFITHGKVTDWVNSWGSEDEQNISK